MVVDIGVVRSHIKPKADSTLYNMRKVDLIEYIRTLEHNYNVAVSFNENQARYIESLGFNGVVRCEDCVSHGNCLTEDTFRIARIDNPYCCCGMLKCNSYGERKDNG